MAIKFDPGYIAEPFLSLCGNYPDVTVYPSDQFRVEWGPIFHRGRLDGSARVLVIGQDPAQHETVIRRILVGEAGRRLQGLLAKLGILTSYVCINTYLYSVYGSVKTETSKNDGLIAYRNQWLDALLLNKQVELVIALGQAANVAWQYWREANKTKALSIEYVAVTHPTQPESASGGDKEKLIVATKKLLENWNAALELARAAIKHPDIQTPHVPYGEAWTEGDRVQIPEVDFPAGIPAWMRENDGWATRQGEDSLAKRRNITITVKDGVIS